MEELAKQLNTLNANWAESNRIAGEQLELAKQRLTKADVNTERLETIATKAMEYLDKIMTPPDFSAFTPVIPVATNVTVPEATVVDPAKEFLQGQ